MFTHTYSYVSRYIHNLSLGLIFLILSSEGYLHPDHILSFQNRKSSTKSWNYQCHQLLSPLSVHFKGCSGSLWRNYLSNNHLKHFPCLLAIRKHNSNVFAPWTWQYKVAYKEEWPFQNRQRVLSETAGSTEQWVHLQPTTALWFLSCAECSLQFPAAGHICEPYLPQRLHWFRFFDQCLLGARVFTEKLWFLPAENLPFRCCWQVGNWT